MRVIFSDYATDVAIQNALRTEFDKDTTFITVAHRLQTIMDYDKIVGFSPTLMCSVSVYDYFQLDGARRWQPCRVRLSSESSWERTRAPASFGERK